MRTNVRNVAHLLPNLQSSVLISILFKARRSCSSVRAPIFSLLQQSNAHLTLQHRCRVIAMIFSPSIGPARAKTPDHRVRVLATASNWYEDKCSSVLQRCSVGCRQLEAGLSKNNRVTESDERGSLSIQTTMSYALMRDVRLCDVVAAGLAELLNV